MNWWITAIESLVVGGLGGLGTVQVLSRHLGERWLEGLKAKYSRELEEFKDALEKKQKKVQAEIDRSVFVTRAQFETEFQSMKDLFKVLSDVFLRLNSLRPMSGIVPAEETEAQRGERLTERINALQKSYNELVTTTAMLRPFYPSSLYTLVEECLKAASSEILDVRTGGRNPLSYDGLKEGENNRTRYSVAYNEVARAIRERVETLAVIPST